MHINWKPQKTSLWFDELYKGQMSSKHLSFLIIPIMLNSKCIFSYKLSLKSDLKAFNFISLDFYRSAPDWPMTVILAQLCCLQRVCWRTDLYGKLYVLWLAHVVCSGKEMHLNPPLLENQSKICFPEIPGRCLAFGRTRR